VKGRIAASLGVWLLAVAFVASIAWLAIDTAGQQVTSAQAAVPLPTDGQTPTATATPAGVATKVAKRKKPARHRPAPTTTTVPVLTTAPATPGATPVSSTYSSNVGRVRVVCTGTQITLNGGYAQPASGWSLRVVTQQQSRIVIAFYASGHQTLMLAADCVQGQPRFYLHKDAPRTPWTPNPSSTPRPPT
jgi:hypothetical protein